MKNVVEGSKSKGLSNNFYKYNIQTNLLEKVPGKYCQELKSPTHAVFTLTYSVLTS